MIWRKFTFVLAIGLLTWITAAQVNALWKGQPQESASAPAPPLPGDGEGLHGALAQSDQEILQRIERKLASNPQDHESRLLKGLLFFKAGRLDRALSEIEELTREAPKFHLAHLIRGDLLMAHFDQVSDIGNTGVLSSLQTDHEDLDRLRGEVQARLKGYLAMIDGENVPRALLLMNAGTRSALLVDKSQHRLYLFENAGPNLPPRLIADFYCVIGKKPGNKKVRGDQRTPEGVYYITGHIDGARLPDRYGVEAFPLDYPNEYDRRQAKTGSGIWLHGTDLDFYSRPPLDSDGCVVLTNSDLTSVRGYLQPGRTPVIIADALQWLSPTEWQETRTQALAALEGWRRAWQSNDVEEYLGHYDKDFRNDDETLAQWSDRKRRVSRYKTFQNIDLQDVELLAYPRGASDGREMIVADFRQIYRSNNFNGDMNKRLYLVRHDSDWRIWYEGGQ